MAKTEIIKKLLRDAASDRSRAAAASAAAAAAAAEGQRVAAAAATAAEEQRIAAAADAATKVHLNLSDNRTTVPSFTLINIITGRLSLMRHRQSKP